MNACWRSHSAVIGAGRVLRVGDHAPRARERRRVDLEALVGRERAALLLPAGPAQVGVERGDVARERPVHPFAVAHLGPHPFERVRAEIAHLALLLVDRVEAGDDVVADDEAVLQPVAPFQQPRAAEHAQPAVVDRQAGRVDRQRAEHGAVREAERLERGRARVGVGGEDLDVDSRPGRPIAARASTQGSAIAHPSRRSVRSGHARASYVRHLRRGERRVPGRSRPVRHLHRVAFTGGRSYGRDRVRAGHPGRRPRARHRGDDRGVGAAGLLGDRVQRRQVRRRRVPDLPRRPQAARAAATARRAPTGPSRASGCSGRASSSTASTRRPRCSSSPSCRSSSTRTAARSRRR